MAEQVIIVCDTCGKPAEESVTIKSSSGNWVKDLCAQHVRELVSGARKPRPGRRRGATARPAAAKPAAAPKRRGRPPKAQGAAPKRRGRPPKAQGAAPKRRGRPPKSSS
jgi:histone H1/5